MKPDFNRIKTALLCGKSDRVPLGDGWIDDSVKLGFLGEIEPLIDNLIEFGFNAIHPLEQGAMDLKKLKKRYGKNLCLVGGIGLDYPLVRGKPEDARRVVKETIDAVGREGGYCVGASNSVPEYVPLENYRAMVEATFKYGEL